MDATPSVGIGAQVCNLCRQCGMRELAPTHTAGRGPCVLVRARMSATPPPKDAFAALMHARESTCPPPDDPWKTAVLYEAHLEHADPSEPLWRVPYFGQIVRSGTADEIFKNRKREHELGAAREGKELGFHAVIGRFGPDAIEWRIVSSESGRRTAMRKLANFEEKRLIAENGGVLRDMDERLEQTLNLTEGGQWGDPAKYWAAIDAKRRCALNKFKAAMEAYVEEFGSALVPALYVNEDNYYLGCILGHFRDGQMRNGMPEQERIEAWAEALPGWQWNVAIAMSKHSLEEFQQRMGEYVRAHNSSLVPVAYCTADEYRLGEHLRDFRRGNNFRAFRCDAKIIEWAESLPFWTWHAPCDTKRNIKWSGMSAEDRDFAERRHAQDRKQKGKQRAELEQLRTIWPGALMQDLPKARKEGLISTPESRRADKLSAMTPSERAIEERRIAKHARANAKKRANLKLLRTVMPNATSRDVARAKREGWMPEAAK